MLTNTLFKGLGKNHFNKKIMGAQDHGGQQPARPPALPHGHCFLRKHTRKCQSAGTQTTVRRKHKEGLAPSLAPTHIPRDVDFSLQGSPSKHLSNIWLWIATTSSLASRLLQPYFAASCPQADGLWSKPDVRNYYANSLISECALNDTEN